MNTVLDDNKTLCLANSERIKLPTTLHMMFEVGLFSRARAREGAGGRTHLLFAAFIHLTISHASLPPRSMF